MAWESKSGAVITNKSSALRIRRNPLKRKGEIFLRKKDYDQNKELLELVTCCRFVAHRFRERGFWSAQEVLLCNKKP